MKKNVNTFILLVICLLFFLSFISSGSSEEDNSKLDTVLLGKIYGIIKAGFFGNFNGEKFLDGGFDGVRDFIKEKGKNTDKIANFTPTGNEDGDIENFEKKLNETLSAYKAQGLSEKDIMRAALDGMLKSLNDPYTIYMDPLYYKQFNESMGASDYSGIGIFIEVDVRNNNKLIIVEPVEGSPAYRAGLKPGDHILEIDGVGTEGMIGEKAAELIKGPEGTAVVLKITRPKASHPIEFEIIRQQIHINSISTKMLDNKILFIRIKIFGETTGEEFENALREIEKEKARGLIIDLRNNGGGYVDAAVSICSHFIPKGKKIVIIKDKNSEESEESLGYSEIKIPVVVLINRYSASASEITAGALQDYGKATAVGDTSFGKGSIQSIEPLGEAGALKYTVANYFTPEGRVINHIGLEPDIKIKMDEYLVGKSNDIQLTRAIEILK